MEMARGQIHHTAAGHANVMADQVVEMPNAYVVARDPVRQSTIVETFAHAMHAIEWAEDNQVERIDVGTFGHPDRFIEGPRRREFRAVFGPASHGHPATHIILSSEPRIEAEDLVLNATWDGRMWRVVNIEHRHRFTYNQWRWADEMADGPVVQNQAIHYWRSEGQRLGYHIDDNMLRNIEAFRDVGRAIGGLGVAFNAAERQMRRAMVDGRWIMPDAFVRNLEAIPGEDGLVLDWFDGGRVTPEEYETRQRRRQEEAAARQAEAQAARLRTRAELRAAEDRAIELLMSVCNKTQVAEWKKHKRITVRGSAGGVYVLRLGWAGNVEKLDAIKFKASRGKIRAKVDGYCIHPGRPVPLADNLVAQLLALRTDEEAFVAKANRGF